MGILIDGSVLAAHARGRLDLSSRLAGREEEPFFLSVVTAAELLFAAGKGGSAAARAQRGALVEAVLERMSLLAVDVATARAHARLRLELAAEGVVPPARPSDLWLAAACLAHGLILATADAARYSAIPGLGVEQWTG